jgi:PAS domain S-box-containing protein
MSDWPPPPEGFSGGVLEAARVARIGVTITTRGEGPPSYVWLNDVAAEILGWPREDLFALSPMAVIAPEELERMTSNRERRDRGEALDSRFETVIVQKNGTRVPVQAAMTTLETAAGRWNVTFFEDIRGRKAAEAALRASEARFRRVVEAAPDAIVISRRGVIAFANPAAARMLGHPTPEALVGVDLGSIMDAEDRGVMLSRMRAMVETGERFPAREYRARRPDGTFVISEITALAVEWEDAPAILAYGRDVTERHRVQEQLARADRLAALGTLAAGVAHEINNPLAYLTLGIEALRAQLALSIPDAGARERALARLEPIAAGASRVAEIVRDLLAFSRDETGTVGQVLVVDAIAAAERLAMHELRHRAKLETRIEGSPRVLGHAGKVEQVMVNLLVNAAQAFDERQPDPKVVVRCADRDGWVEIEVEDNGPGIPPELLGRVYDPFFTTKPAGVGTGLGLSICHGIVTRMGGTIAIESEVGRGTIARVRLPSVRRKPSEPKLPVVTGGALPNRLRVLVADDEPALLRALRALLEPEHEVTLASSGEDALARLSSATADPPDVVLCDVMMPGLTGVDVYAAICRARPELAERFVFMTGGAMTPHTTAFLDSVANVRLEKPFTLAQLEEALIRAAARRV